MKNHKRFYVYLHYKADTNEIFYIGKGAGNRDKSVHRYRQWKGVVKKHGFRFERYAENLTESESFAVEIALIALYGRKDLGLGPLINHTNGGEGVSGWILTEEQRMNRSKIAKEMWDNSEIRNRIIESNIVAQNNPDVKKKKSISIKKTISKDQNDRIRRSNIMKEIWKSESRINRIKKMHDPISKKKRAKAISEGHKRNKLNILSAD